jgi:hypothetical protein
LLASASLLLFSSPSSHLLDRVWSVVGFGTWFRFGAVSCRRVLCLSRSLFVCFCLRVCVLACRDGDLASGPGCVLCVVISHVSRFLGFSVSLALQRPPRWPR